MRQRIFTASKAGDLAKVRRLQRLMLDSRSNALVSVRRVTERNAGRLTAGVDGEVVLTPEAKLALADRIQHSTDTFTAMPVRRVYIPKPSGKRRALAKPVAADGHAGERMRSSAICALPRGAGAGRQKARCPSCRESGEIESVADRLPRTEAGLPSRHCDAGADFPGGPVRARSWRGRAWPPHAGTTPPRPGALLSSTWLDGRTKSSMGTFLVIRSSRGYGDRGSGCARQGLAP